MTTLEVVPRLPPALASMDPREVEELACRSHLGVWTARKMGMEMAPFHWEWCELRMTQERLALIAPRDHAKSQTFTVHGVAWEVPQKPGLQTFVFAETGEMAEALVERIWVAVEQTEPWLCEGKHAKQGKAKLTFANGATVKAAGAGKGVRGQHPDVIIGDDVLSEEGCRSEAGRRKTASWWKGTVGGMAHPGTIRKVRPDPDKGFIKVKFPPTRVFLVGTPFHEDDLLMSMKTNPIYHFRRYAAEFQPEDLVPGTLAVDVA